VTSTNRYGLAKISLHYPSRPPEESSSISVRLAARDVVGRISRFDDSVYASPVPAIWLSLAHSLLRPSQAIEGTIHGSPGTDVDVDVLSETTMLAHLQVHLAHAYEPISIPAGPGFRGLITLRTYTMANSSSQSDWEMTNYGAIKSVLYPEDRSLSVKLSGIRPSYSPGTKVDAALQLQSAASGATPGVFGVSVFDTAVEQRAETETEANDRWFGNGWWWYSGTSVAGVTRETLDKTDTSTPIPGDLDLAAEAVLTDAEAQGMRLESNSEDHVRAKYSGFMERQLRPLGAAVIAAHPARLPATLDALRQISASAHLNDSVLVDPWNTPYKVENSEEWNDDRLTLRSAGPDKHFGTPDDFATLVARRNIFSIPGERLSALLNQAARAGHPLPGTLDSLIQLARAGGLDLDSDQQDTRQRDGKPFKYAIVLQRNLYSIHVLRDTDNFVWSSPSIDYFIATESRLNAALQNWVGPGKVFPETEADARQAFSAAGIDFNALRDPLGKPFVLREGH
jgi:hypothetical protein